MQAWPWLWKIAKAEPLTAAVEVRVVEHDVGALAAELQLHPLHVARRRLDDPPPDRGGAGERDLAHASGGGPGARRRSGPARARC